MDVDRASPTVRLEAGRTLGGKFRIESPIGEGGAGIVLAATHMYLQLRVAIKVLHRASLDALDGIARFEREAQAAAAIKSEHVARVMDYGVERGVPYLVMEYLEGSDLRSHLARSGPLPVAQAVDCVLQACEALAEAHKRGIVHRDLKPANLFLAHRADGSPMVKVLDFGLAKFAPPPDVSSAVVDADSSRFGTAMYMAPEQLLESTEVDAHADVWGLGVVLYELLTCKRPFERRTVQAVSAAILFEEAAPLRSLRADVPEEIERAVARCLEKNMEKRFESIGRIAAALAPFASRAGRLAAERALAIERGDPAAVGARADAPILPLSHRLPNPPRPFVGREVARARLARAIAEGPVAVVWGLGGMGKTSLVQETLHDAFPDRVDRTVLVSMRPNDTIDQLRLDVLHALASARGIDYRDWSGALRDPEALVAASIDLAEDGDLWIVADDLHHGDRAATGEWLRQLASHARRSRWIATSRVDPEVAEIAPQTLPLGAMEAAELNDLARRYDPDLDAAQLRAAVQAAAGSPWRLRRWAGGARSISSDDPLDLVAGLDGAAVRVVETLAVLDAPVPVDVVSKLASAMDGAYLDELTRRGLLETTSAGSKLHDVARATLRAALRPETAREVSARCARVLAGLDPSLAVEALRLFLAAEDEAAAEELLGARFGELLAGGHAPRVWQMLDARPALAPWRLECAAQMEGGVAFDWAMSLPRPEPLRERIAWLEVRRQAAPAALLVEEADAIADTVQPDDPIALRAVILAARSRMRVDEWAGLADRLGALQPATREDRALRDAVLALPLVDRDGPERGLALLDEVRRGIGALPEHARARIRVECLASYVAMGRLCEANALVAEDASLLLGARLSATLLATVTLVFVWSGKLDAARPLLDRLDAMSAHAPALAAYAAMLRCAERMARGDLDGLDDAIGRTLAALIDSGHTHNHGIQLAIAYQLAISRGRRRVGHHGVRMTRAVSSAYANAYERMHASRWRRDVAAVPIEDTPTAMVLVPSAIADAEALLVRSEARRALTRVRDARRRAHDHGLGLMEAEACDTQCAILAVLGRSGALARAARELASMAQAQGSPRRAAEARLYAAIARARAPDRSLLSEVAACSGASPVAARRASTLLGRRCVTDAIDDLVVRAARARWRKR